MNYKSVVDICQNCFEMGKQQPREFLMTGRDGSYLLYECPYCGFVRTYRKESVKFRIANALRLQVLEQEMR